MSIQPNGDSTMLNNLRAEMKRNGLNSVKLAAAIGKSEKAVRDKIAGRTNFNVFEAMSIRDKFFPNMTLEYLFARCENSDSSGT